MRCKDSEERGPCEELVVPPETMRMPGPKLLPRDMSVSVTLPQMGSVLMSVVPVNHQGPTTQLSVIC